MEPTLEPPSQLNQILDRHMSFWLTQPNLVPFLMKTLDSNPTKNGCQQNSPYLFSFLKDTEKIEQNTTRPRGVFFFKFAVRTWALQLVSRASFFFWMFFVGRGWSNGDRINGLFFIYLQNGVYWGYNPLILTFFTNFLGYP